MSSIFERILDFFFPRYCFQCQELLTREEVLFCQNCATKLPFLKGACPICASPDKDPDHPCGLCLSGRAFDRVLTPFRYKPPLKQAIKDLKFGGKIFLARELARLWKRHLSLPEVDLVLPVPLHQQRLIERGFNQSLLLARFLSPRPPSLFLERSRPTKPQSELSLKERRSNVKGAFCLRRKDSLEGKRILLVDDVMTSGATVEECARVLKRAGAKEVLVAVMARAG